MRRPGPKRHGDSEPKDAVRGKPGKRKAKPSRSALAPRPLAVGQQVELEIPLEEPDDSEALAQHLARALGLATTSLPEVRLLKRSLDARRHRVRHRWLFEITSLGEIHAEQERGGPAPNLSAKPAPEPAPKALRLASPTPLGLPEPRAVSQPERVLIVGDGPAGLFCAYQLARFGIGSTVLERGKQVQPRRHDLKALNHNGPVDEDSNYCFGEGGAGTYSDGKLYTRSHKRGGVRDVLELLAAHGAPEDILTEARPHIGSNRLPKVVSALREHLAALGVQFRFGARVVDLEKDAAGRAVGVRLADGSSLSAERVVLATGHSASAVYQMLAEHGVPLTAKAFAVGARIEHPQSLINQIQYGKHAQHPRLSNAAYRIACNIEERGVFSFCMCPGGFIVPASTEPGRLVVNGMSLKRRDSPFANSGFVVQVEVADMHAAAARLGIDERGALLGLELQRRVEAAAFDAGGGGSVAPATRVSDFVAGRSSSVVGETSYLPGLRAADLSSVLDTTGLNLASRMRKALGRFGANMPGYVSQEALLIGVESRTSSPVRIPRDEVSLQLLGLPNIFPCGEGAGYAGGIMSAAIDGMRVARAVAESLGHRATLDSAHANA